MRELLIVGAGGFVGAVLRYLVSGAVQRASHSALPYGTLMVNVLGCFAFGLIAGFAARSPESATAWRAFLSIGVLGAFTTYSTFNYDALVLLRSGRGREALVYVLVSLLLGVLAFLLAELIALRA